MAETLVFSGQLSIIYSLPLYLKHCSTFTRCDILASKFLGIGVIDPQSVFNRHKKVIFCLGIADGWKKTMIALKKKLAIIYIIVKNLAFSLIQSVGYICLSILKICFTSIDIDFKSSIPKFN